jgi:hypothetical protein
LQSAGAWRGRDEDRHGSEVRDKPKKNSKKCSKPLAEWLLILVIKSLPEGCGKGDPKANPKLFRGASDNYENVLSEENWRIVWM